jgi:hypothetical protein
MRFLVVTPRRQCTGEYVSYATGAN